MESQESLSPPLTVVRSKNRRSRGVFSGILEELDQLSVILLTVGLTTENETNRTRTVGLKPTTRWNHLGSIGGLLRWLSSKESACQCRKSVSGGYDSLEEDMTTHSSILAWRISWTEEPGGLQSVGSQRVRYN